MVLNFAHQRGGLWVPLVFSGVFGGSKGACLTAEGRNERVAIRFWVKSDIQMILEVETSGKR